MSKEVESVSKQIGACGVFCDFCQVFRHIEYRCFGCEWANRMLRKSRESKKGCMFWECTQNKKVECCFMCVDFPCQTHYDSQEAVYTKQALDSWKELRRTGLTFWGRRKELEALLKAEDKEAATQS
ncbi:MAG: DUF3795 domain-containing protein [Candidatus Bathyarchaeota archaeon]|nr:DUF3795 domain-containing protein [Candidatus Bathyarchaeota archaeon]MDH5787320.1 DUF3795 domain-containing protein [Candidatus Bathyarchaeota archaeon]